MEITVILVLFVTFITVKGEANIACTGIYGGYCSDSKICSSLGGKVETLPVRCKCKKACCKCTDQCPAGSTCITEEDTCNGKIDTKGCCGNRVCCTPTTCVINCPHICHDACPASKAREGECCGSTCCFQDI
ncbi:keratin-associated protein 4-7-like isoform X1 [Mytilus edulis]|uniref:keratin-associated protein 4-7-like isoform X1 n=1 Tax=Mytilus edulis TaxID=6550 RepID=UPI0039EFEC4C